ncbi:hypothetical protein ACQ4PT_067493 [Festuca glaucescens]
MASASSRHERQGQEEGDEEEEELEHHITSPLLVGAHEASSSSSPPEPDEEEENSPIEQVALTVPVGDDPDTPVLTFRMWVLGTASCFVLSFLNQFFWYRKEPLTITAISAQIAVVPLGRLMAATLPERAFFRGRRWEFTLNPGPFNVKEHVLITIFANAGAGTVYAIHVVTAVRVFYGKQLTFFVSLLVVLTTQVLGFGWAGIFRRYLVEPAAMWWPSNLVQVSLFRALHEKESRSKGGFTRSQFFLVAFICSFVYYIFPGYLFQMLTSLSWICWVFPNSVLAQQLGSGLYGLGIGSIGSRLGICFPPTSGALLPAPGSPQQTSLQASSSSCITFFAITYGVGFASLTATIVHVLLFHGSEIWQLSRSAFKEKRVDVHTKLMRGYKQVPEWWFICILIANIAITVFACEYYIDQLQLPWWGVLLACAIAFFFTLPIGIITATTNQTPGLNIITEYIMGVLVSWTTRRKYVLQGIWLYKHEPSSNVSARF